MRKSFDWFIYFILFFLPIITVIYMFDILAMHYIFGLVPYFATFFIIILSLIKKMKYKVKDIVVIVLIVLSLVSIPVSSILCTFKPYNLLTKNNENGLEITGYRINWINDYDKEFYIEIPSKIKNKSVNSIGDKAFIGCQYFDHLVIPNGIEIIKKASFSEAKYTQLTLPESLKIIENEAFCSRSREEEELLDFIILPDKLEYVGERAFKDIANTIIVPIENNNDWSKTWCFGVYDTVVHYDVKYAKVLDGVLYISKDNLNASVAAITDESNIVIYEKIEFDNKVFIVKTIEPKAGYYSKFEHITIPRTIETIKKFAFAYNSNLKEIFIPNNVLKVEGYVFYQCTNVNIRVEHLNIPKEWDGLWDYIGTY